MRHTVTLFPHWCNGGVGQVCPELIYISHQNSFASKVDIYDYILPPEMIGPRGFDWHLNFYMRSNIEGYELGIVTPASFKKAVLPDSDDARIPLTTLPYTELSIMYGKKLTVADQKKRAENRKKHAWKEAERDGDDVILFDMPFEIDHPDFTVYYNTI